MVSNISMLLYVCTHIWVKPGKLNWLDNILSRAVTAEISLVIPDVTGMLRVLQKTYRNRHMHKTILQSHLLVEVNAAIVKEVLPILCRGEGGHQMQWPLTDPAVGPVIAIILEILLNATNRVKCVWHASLYQGVSADHVPPLALIQSVKLIRPDQSLWKKKLDRGR